MARLTARLQRAAFERFVQQGQCDAGHGGNGTAWTWGCNGTNGGGNASCSAPFVPPTINGTCGSAAGIFSATPPSSGLCSKGNATPVSGGNGSPWAWSCTGSNGGPTATCTAPSQKGQTTGGQKPGPSSDLFNSPYYSCTTNYFVAANGSDSNDGKAAPWLTLQHADNMNVGAGACINVAPGTYDGVLIHNGGNAATATGYVVYRCQQLDACIVTGNGGVNGSSSFDTVRTTDGTPPNFIQIDGFKMVGRGTFYPIGVSVYNGDGSAKVASHHVWVLNSIVTGFGQAGLQLSNSEYLYAIHNTLYGNSNTQCDAQGSGISYWAPNALTGYTPAADDETNPNPMLGPTWINGSSFFHNVIEWNVTYNNALTKCGTANNPSDTDGNGIIMDSFLNNNYPNETLVAFNVTYNNGGGGIHVFYSGNVTVANNSCFNNYLDPADNATWRGCIDDADGFGNTYLNNIAVAIPAVTSTCNISPPFTRFEQCCACLAVAGTFQHMVQ